MCEIIKSVQKLGGRKNQVLYAKAVRKRREFNTLVKNAKKDYFVGKLTQYGNDQETFWKTILELLGSKNPPSVERVFEPDGQLCSLQDSVNLITEFFAKVGDRVANIINSKPYAQWDHPVPFIMDRFTLFNEESLIKIVNEFSIEKSSGIKDVPPKALVDAIRARPDIFVTLCKKSLEMGSFL